MRHNMDHRNLSRTASHRKAMLSNMVTSLFERERIETTTVKAKEAKRLAEKIITFARKGDLSARRHVARTVKNPVVLRKLFDDIAPRYVDRPGGYTRVLKTGVRKGDAAKTAILELVGKNDKPRGKKKTSRKTFHKVEIPESPVIAAKKAAEKAAKAAAKEAKAAEEAAKKAEEEAAVAEAAEPEAEEAPAEEEEKKE
jgi:large subunit ribosomal protein L17